MLSRLDIIIIIAYLLGLLIMGYYLGKSNKTQKDYFLANRSMSWFPIGISIVATMLSANSLVGGPGWSYSARSIAPYMMQFSVPLAIFVVMFATAPVIYGLKLTSVYEYIELRLGVQSRIIVVLSFFANSIIQISSMVFVPAIIIQKFTGWSLELVIPVVVVISIIYTLLGGIKAVIWTDVLQMIVLWVGLLVSFGIIIYKSENHSLFSLIQTASESESLSIFQSFFDIKSSNSFFIALIGGFFMWFRYFGFDQGQVQRILTSKSFSTVNRSYLSSAIVTNVSYFLFLLLGIFLFIHFNGREFKSSNDVTITFIAENFPVGLLGIVISGIFAAAMSSIDSLLNSMTTVYIKDIHERFIVKDQKPASLKTSMIASAICGIIIILVAYFGFSGTTKSVLEVVGSYIAYISGPMCGVFILAMYTEKSNNSGVVIGFIVGFILTFVLSQITGMTWLFKPFVGAALTSIIGYTMSSVLPAKKSITEVRKYTIKGIKEKVKSDTAGTDEQIVPFTFNKYNIAVLGIFLSQILFFIILSRL